MAKLILGAFTDQSKANDAIQELERVGVPSNDFSLVMQDTGDKTEGFRETLAESPPVRTAAEVAAGGAAVGGLAGLIAGAIATAGMFVAGPAMLLAGLGWVALTTATGGAVGAAAGGLVGALVGMGVPEDVAKHHQSVIKQGGVLLGVEDEKVSEQQAREILEHHGAEQIVTIQHGELPAKMTTQ